MADFRLMVPSNEAVRQLEAWQPVGEFHWRMERLAIYCHDLGFAGPAVDGEDLIDPSPSPSGSSELKVDRELSATRTVKRATLRKVVTALKAGGGITGGTPLNTLKLNVDFGVNETNETTDSREESLSVTERKSFEQKYKFEANERVFLVARYRRRQVALYLDFQDHLDILYERKALAYRRRRSPNPVEGPGHWRTKNQNVVEEGCRPLGIVDYWELLPDPAVRSQAEYKCEVPRPWAISWDPNPGPAVANPTVELDRSEQSLYDLSNTGLWKPRRPPRE